MNYKIISNEQKLKDFINWLPELETHEKYYVTLFARKKYSDKIKSNDKTQIKRFVSNKERLFGKIKQLECVVGSYKLKDQDVPQDSLVLYINPNPRDMRKASFKMAKNVIDLLQSEKNFNIHAEALSCIQQSKSKSHFCDFDIDDKAADVSKMDEILPNNCFDVLETRGGYHILVNTRIAPKEIKWHKLINDAFNVDQIGDQLIPVVGCVQGDFNPDWVAL